MKYPTPMKAIIAKMTIRAIAHPGSPDFLAGSDALGGHTEAHAVA
jgi:hypothetical protein